MSLNHADGWIFIWNFSYTTECIFKRYCWLKPIIFFTASFSLTSYWMLQSSEIYRYVVHTWTDVSKEHIIFKFENEPSKKPACSRWIGNKPTSRDSPKRRFTYRFHGTISQKRATFITTAVRTSNPTFCTLLQRCSTLQDNPIWRRYGCPCG
jgi:hypothetical protein